MLHILQISHFIRFFISRINKHTSIVIIWTCLLCRIDYIACMLLQISFHNRKKFCGISCCLLHVRRLRVFVALKISRKVFNFSRAFFCTLHPIELPIPEKHVNNCQRREWRFYRFIIPLTCHQAHAQRHSHINFIITPLGKIWLSCGFVEQWSIGSIAWWALPLSFGHLYIVFSITAGSFLMSKLCNYSNFVYILLHACV